MAVSNQHWALLGGTFDPVHIGHLRTAINLVEAGFDEVQMIPNGQPPHKSHTIANAQQRKTMLELSLSEQTNIHINSIEIDHKGQSYSVETLKRLRAKPDTPKHLTWVLGMDAWLGLPLWYKAEELLNLANILVISRPQSTQALNDWHTQKLASHKCELKELLTSPCNKIGFLNLPELDISSSQLKQKLKQNQCIRYLVPQKVLDFIQQQELYKY